jgi:hypothetical protein
MSVTGTIPTRVAAPREKREKKIMIDFLSKVKLVALIEASAKPSLTIYMPTHRAGVDTAQDHVRLRNLLRRARRQLAAMKLGSNEISAFLKPVRDLAGNAEFWRHPGDGLALFLSPEGFSHFRLPIEFQDLVVVSDRYHVKPLLPLMAADSRYYILALSQKRVRLFEATRYHIRQMEIDNLPASLREVSRPDRDQGQLQAHTARTAAAGGGPAIFHGHGPGREETKTQLLRFFQLVDSAVRGLLREEQAPLAVAGVEYLFPLYKEANTYPRLLKDFVRGNPDHLSAEELRKAAEKIVAPYFQKEREEALAQYRKLAGSERVQTDLKRIVEAAQQGRVLSAFVGIGVQQWGSWDAANGRVEFHEKQQPGDEDLLNLVAIQTYRRGGRVYALPTAEVPGQAVVAAVYRF